MAKMYAFLAPGSEEVECLAVVDILLRGGVDVVLVSITDEREVVTSHNITIKTDVLFSEVNFDDADVLFLPGGIPGTYHLADYEPLQELLKKGYEKGILLAAICAAPLVFGRLGFLQGRHATCYPGFEKELIGAVYDGKGVVRDGNMTTARGLGYALDLGIELLGQLSGQEQAESIKKAIQYD